MFKFFIVILFIDALTLTLTMLGYNRQCSLCGEEDEDLFTYISEELFNVLKDTLLEKGYTFKELNSKDENGRLTASAICSLCLSKVIKKASEQPEGIFDFCSDNFYPDE